MPHAQLGPHHDHWRRSLGSRCHYLRTGIVAHIFQLIYRLLLQGVQEKLWFFTIHCNPSLTYIAVRDLQSSQRNASVQALLHFGGVIFLW